MYLLFQRRPFAQRAIYLFPDAVCLPATHVLRNLRCLCDVASHILQQGVVALPALHAAPEDVLQQVHHRRALLTSLAAELLWTLPWPHAEPTNHTAVGWCLPSEIRTACASARSPQCLARQAHPLLATAKAKVQKKARRESSPKTFGQLGSESYERVFKGNPVLRAPLSPKYTYEVCEKFEDIRGIGFRGQVGGKVASAYLGAPTGCRLNTFRIYCSLGFAWASKWPRLTFLRLGTYAKGFLVSELTCAGVLGAFLRVLQVRLGFV